MDDHVNEEEGFYHEAKFTDKNGQLRTTRIPVVQELARQGFKHLPKRFIALPPSDHPFDPSSLHVHVHEQTLPSIDMAKLRAGFDSEVRTKEVERLAEGAREWGMFLIRNHGIEEWVLDDVKDVVKGFFGLSFEEKKANVGCYSSVDNMGYGRNFVKSENQPLDWIDRLTMRIAPKDKATDLGHLVWPQKPPNFRQAIEKYLKGAREVLDELLQHLAESLSLDRNVFLQNFEPTKSVMNVRVNYYPPCPRPDLALGITPHSDASALTLLLQFGSTKEGLQILKDSKWLTVQWPNDYLLVNFGDLMEIMSNGLLQSPWHRVRTQLEAERFSVALFYNPPAQAEIGPARVNNMGDDGYKYKKVIVDEYLQKFYKISPTATKQAITFAKV